MCNDTIWAMSIKKQTTTSLNLVWDRFNEIAKIPRKSGQEKGMIKYMQSWAKKEGFFYETDGVGNVLILIPATKGLEGAPGTILQGHVDMVCVGEPDPAIHGVKLTTIKHGGEEWLTTQNTSAGFDNGIGLAVSLALTNKETPHGPLAIMATVDEEVGLLGVTEMSFKTPLDSYKYLLNFDSEDEGEATISSAGGGDSVITLPIEKEDITNQSVVKITVKGLMGGHSGVEIGEGRLNSIKVLSTTLSRLVKDLGEINIISLNAGIARNVIPSTAEATIAIDSNKESQLADVLNKTRKEILTTSTHKDEQSLALLSSKAEKKPTEMITSASSLSIIDLLSKLPHGVISWSQSVKDLVETSTNLAILKTKKDTLAIELMTRSSVDSDVVKIRKLIQVTAGKFKGKVTESNAYSGWPANPGSKVNKIAKQAWLDLTGEELKLLAIHAGLECGVILGKYPHLEAISVGPTIKGAHSTKERVNIKSVERFYHFAKKLVEALVKT